MNIKSFAFAVPVAAFCSGVFSHDGEHEILTAGEAVSHVAHSTYHVGVLTLVLAAVVVAAAAVLLHRFKA